MKLILIAAHDPNLVIGKNGELPWHYSEDLKFFKRQTLGYPIVMGRVVFEELNEKAFEKGIAAFGPFPADSFFGSGKHQQFDMILAMYHDQGLTPFKALSFGEGVNYSAGLPVVRTSPDHGTALEIAGQGIANPQSFREAVYRAIDLIKNRKIAAEVNANPLKTNRKKR